MGIARTNGKASNHTQRLGAIAREFEPRRAPYWVSQPDGRHPSLGWWWVPQGSEHPSFLGHNHIVAEIDLCKLRDGLYKTTA